MTAVITGEAMRKDADTWIDANPEAWGRMKELAAFYAARNRRFSMEKLIQVARYDMETQTTDQMGFKINNNIRSALGKRLVEEVPQVERYIERRKSRAYDPSL